MTPGNPAPRLSTDTAPAPGLILSAPASGSGKTTVALALMRALARHGLRIGPAKVGPDYIDPGFHTAACGRPSITLDPWAMRAETRGALTGQLAADSDLIVAEGAMGLFDGAADGRGSCADLAAETGWPVLLILDVKGQSGSAAAVLRGFATHRPDITIGGVLLNRVGGIRHADMLASAIMDTVMDMGLDIPILGCLPRQADLALDSRHLGLVQARERGDLDGFLERAADWIEGHADLDAIRGIARPGRLIDTIVEPGSPSGSFPPGSFPPGPPPLGQRIAVAVDTAFDFSYPHILDAWRDAGAEIMPFSPLADQAPDDTADAVYLPGGYPELHGPVLAANATFLTGLRDRAAAEAVIFGECGGYMVLGEGLTDADGTRHVMAGLLPLETSFAERRLHLGYRRAVLRADLGPWAKGMRLVAHEFHYSTAPKEDTDAPLFSARDAMGIDLGSLGMVRGRVGGSYLHIIDREV
ncbi:cobyrinate a,c-diamide synthase [Rhodospirillaceae bacterium KN72]|uniref:Cobyrinate a,c-diamide synthase n=1 Tax=Pacificispira spongiicola TaxID=2729598 RepID=A0A7Y0E0M9_9PROT|nr:cobyrinate a,c-diamide synthase [Pacificispira spongiicola]NMM45062.1 cobyrinate a,c-diamide synthase [Pacificispira spongiicola]